MAYEIKPDCDEPLFEFIEQAQAEGVTLYPIQEEAILAWAEADGGVLLSVPTGSGKTLVAEACIYEALCRGQTVYYTTPLVALTEQKFDEFRDRFGEQNVGLVTGNKKVNAGAPLLVAVTEILTNRLLVPLSAGDRRVCDVVVFDEFHYFNDLDRGWVWETAVMLLPQDVKLLMLSATVSKTVPFVAWLKQQRGREFTLVASDERRVPLSYVWCEELLPDAIEQLIEKSRHPALIFAFDREGCYQTANQLLSLPTGRLLSDEEQQELGRELDPVDFKSGAGPRFRKLLRKGIGVHHAGVLPKWRHLVEDLFGRKLLKFVVCTETLAAGINLPARTVLIPELVKYSGGAKKRLLDPATAHQIFGRAGRPQFDREGFAYALAPTDEVKISNWEKRIKKLGRTPTKSELNKRPRRDEKMVRWNKDQFTKLIQSPPAPLESRSMLTYAALVFLLQEHDVPDLAALLARRFTTPETIRDSLGRLRQMLANLEALDYIETEPGPMAEDAVPIPLIKRRNLNDVIVTTLATDFENLLDFRGLHPLFGHWLVDRMRIGALEEKLAVLEALLVISNNAAGPRVYFDEAEGGPLDQDVREAIGKIVAAEEKRLIDEGKFEGQDDELVRQKHIAPVPQSIAGKLLYEFDHLVPAPEPVRLQPKMIARALLVEHVSFFEFIEHHGLATQEGVVYRYLLRLVLMARQFAKLAVIAEAEAIEDGEEVPPEDAEIGAAIANADDALAQVPRAARDYRRIELAVLEALEPIDPSYLDEWKREHGIPVVVDS